MSFLIIDPSHSGASGDILIAALLDLKNTPFRNEFCHTFEKLFMEFDPSFRLKCDYKIINGFRACQLNIIATKKCSIDEMHSLILRMEKKLSLSQKCIKLSTKTLNCLIEAEKKIHGKDTQNNKIHFHELASIDTVFDIVGFFYLWEKLDLFSMNIFILPIAVGGGSIEIAHGKVPVPTPATTEIIKQGNLSIKGGPFYGELLTPTGAALLTNLNASPINYFPLMTVDKIGISSGTREVKEKGFPFLRIIQGTSIPSLQDEDINILETNIDDVDGETLGYLFEILYKDNLVLDLSIINTITKKNRPGFLIKAIVEPSKTFEVAKVLVKELGTLGVRVLPGFRHIVSREQEEYQIDIRNEKEKIIIKRGFLETEKISEKIEFEDLKRLAQKKGVPLRKIRNQILAEIYKKDEDNAGH